ncbi:putative serine dehydratase domain-containing protein [Trichoderma compactum]
MTMMMRAAAMAHWLSDISLSNTFWLRLGVRISDMIAPLNPGCACRENIRPGNFPTNNLQQLSTNVISENDQAVRVATEVCSVYPERNEALVNAGVIALSRETSGLPGFGRVVGQPEWAVVRLSQEHGILGTENSSHNAAEIFKVGQRICLYCNHVCITAAAFHVFYVVDENDVVVDTWVPWTGW